MSGLIENLTYRLIGEFNRGESAANSFHQHRNSEVADNRFVRGPHRANNVCRHTFVGETWMNRRSVSAVCGVGCLPPETRAEIFSYHGRIVRNGSDQAAIARGDEHSVDPRMRIKCGAQPLL